MKKKPRRKAGTAERDDEDNASSSSTPVKNKENQSPRSSLENVYHQTFITLLQDFDSNVAMTKKDIMTESQVTEDTLTHPFFNALIHMSSQIKNMKWGDYLKMQENPKEDKALPGSSDGHAFAVPSGPLKLETPALRSSSRLAKNKLPVITPKFDPSAATAINKRLPKPGEMLVSLKGSPVAIPNPTPFNARGVSTLAIADDKDVLAAILNNNPEALTNALRDKNTCKAFVKAYNSAKMRKE